MNVVQLMEYDVSHGRWTQLRLIRRAENGQMTLGPHVMTWANAFLARSDITQEFFATWEEFGGLP